jgi:hypothetical protein
MLHWWENEKTPIPFETRQAVDTNKYRIDLQIPSPSKLSKPTILVGLFLLGFGIIFGQGGYPELGVFPLLVGFILTGHAFYQTAPKPHTLECSFCSRQLAITFTGKKQSTLECSICKSLHIFTWRE